MYWYCRGGTCNRCGSTAISDWTSGRSRKLAASRWVAPSADMLMPLQCLTTNQDVPPIAGKEAPTEGTEAA